MSNNNDSRLFNSIGLHLELVNVSKSDLDFKEYTITRPNGKVIHCKKLVKVKNTPDKRKKTYEEYFKREQRELWNKPIIEQIPYWDKNYWIRPDLRSPCEFDVPSQRWDDEIDGKYHIDIGIKTGWIEYPKDRKWINERNAIIANIRQKHMKKNGMHYYEKLGEWMYKNPHDKKLFFEAVEAFDRDLAKRDENFKKYIDTIFKIREKNEIYDFVDGFYHSVSRKSLSIIQNQEEENLD